MGAGYSVSTIYDHSVSANGAVAQLGERMTGSHEVRGSIPLGSTNLPLVVSAQCDYSVTELNFT
jgi:hypothetical protein